jgi:cardiolipin hydrolase
MFFPNEKNVDRLIRYISVAKKSLKICVFNLTHNNIAKAVLDRHKSGIEVKIITDDECMNNLGSDIKELANAGIPVRTDNAKEFHMHNKFVIIDDSVLITGSFNWTV